MYHLILLQWRLVYPQETVLGPIPFIIYMNDVADNIKHSTIRLFADDIIYTL